MKKIRLTEQQLNKVIKESVVRLLKEYYEEPEFDTVTVYYNSTSGEIKNTDNDLGDGKWYIFTVRVSNYSEEDAGIGSYEFWGSPGYDSRPYYQPTECEIESIDGGFIIENGEYIEDLENVQYKDLSREELEMIEREALDFFESQSA